jgi:hypothetical protein
MASPARKARSPKTAPPVTAAPPAKSHWFQPREYQQLAFDKLADGIRRAMLMWHRRAGKDAFALELADRKMTERVGAYWHLYPRQVQAKRAIWNGVDPATGRRFIDMAFPREDGDYRNDQDMFLRRGNGSTWQLGGSDYYDRLVGSNVLGVVFSEWALCDPAAWDYIRPILAENGGWAVFISTYRGRNHAYQMARRLKADPEWYIDERTILQTKRLDGSPVVSLEAVEADRRSGMRESLVQQEYFCNPAAALPGAVYGSALEAIQATRGGNVVYDPTFPVVAAWNVGDAPANLSVVFFQEKGNEIHVIGSRSWMFAELHECLADVAALPWKVRTHLLKADDDGVWAELFTRHQISVEETRAAWSIGKTAAVTNAMLERTFVDTAPRPYAGAGLETNNELLIDSLAGYRVKELEGQNGRDNFDDKPVTDFERYLTRAVELYAVWNFGRAPFLTRARNYSAYDRAVI